MARARNNQRVVIRSCLRDLLKEFLSDLECSLAIQLARHEQRGFRNLQRVRSRRRQCSRVDQHGCFEARLTLLENREGSPAAERLSRQTDSIGINQVLENWIVTI